MAKVAAELGELSVAARRYLRLVEPTDAGDGKRSAPTRWTTLEDLQQASNCLSRAALKDVRGSGEAGCTADAKRDLLRAVDLGRRAVDLSPEGESWGILAGALKRLAIVETGEERARRIGQAAAAYQRRLLLEPDGTTGAGHASVGIDEPYTRHNAAQLALLLDRGAVVEIAPAARVEPTPTIVDQRVSSYKDYWEAATFGDELLTRMLAANDRDGAAHLGDLMVAAYERAFASRSTWKERSSTFTHLCDLLDLLPEGDDRRDCLREAIGRLGDWESTYVDNEVGATSQRSGTEEER